MEVQAASSFWYTHVHPSSLDRSVVEYMRQESWIRAIYARGMQVKYGCL